MPARILLVGRGLYALALARVLGSDPTCEVLLATSVNWDFARSSQFVARSWVAPKADDDPDAFVAAVKFLAESMQVHAVIPVAEETLYLARKKGVSAPVLFCADQDLLCRLHHKHGFTVLAAEAGLLVPETVLVQSSEDMCRAVQAMSSGAFCKPVYSRGGCQGFALEPPEIPALTATNISQRLLQAARPVSTRDPWVVQQLLRGRHISCYSVCRDGVVGMHVAYEAIAPVQGFACVRRRVDGTASLRWVRALVAHVHFTGQLGVDFIEAADGRLYPLECNPRATNGIAFFEDATGEASVRFQELAIPKVAKTYAPREPFDPPMRCPQAVRSTVPLLSQVRVLHPRRSWQLWTSTSNAVDDMFRTADPMVAVIAVMRLLMFLFVALWTRLTCRSRASLKELGVQATLRELVVFPPGSR